MVPDTSGASGLRIAILCGGTDARPHTRTLVGAFTLDTGRWQYDVPRNAMGDIPARLKHTPRPDLPMRGDTPAAAALLLAAQSAPADVKAKTFAELEAEGYEFEVDGDPRVRWVLKCRKCALNAIFQDGDELESVLSRANELGESELSLLTLAHTLGSNSAEQ